MPKFEGYKTSRHVVARYVCGKCGKKGVSISAKTHWVQDTTAVPYRTIQCRYCKTVKHYPLFGGPLLTPEFVQQVADSFGKE